MTLTTLRPGNGQVKEYKLNRAHIKVDTVKDMNGRREFPLLENNVGYIRVTQFGEQTASDLEDALKKLESKGVESVVLDLRANPGGLLDQAVKVCEKFLPRGQLVVSTEGRDARQKSTYHAMGGYKLMNVPLVVLVNSGSASASEIVAGCLQDTTSLGLTKAIVVGEQTFGKGSVQSILPLQDGSALRLTTAKYYTPSHKVIHERGITPDIQVTMTEQEESDLAMKRTPGALETLDPKEQERIKNVQDVQLERALDQLKGFWFFTKRTPGTEKRAKTEKVAAK